MNMTGYRSIPVFLLAMIVFAAAALPSQAQDGSDPGREFALDARFEVRAEVNLAGGRRLLSVESAQGDALLLRLKSDGRPDAAFGPLGLRSAGLTPSSRSVGLVAGGRDDFWMLSAGATRDDGWRLQYHGDDGELREFWTLDIAGVADRARLHRLRDGSVLVVPYPVDRLQIWRIKRGAPVSRLERPLGVEGEALGEVVQMLESQGRVYVLGELLATGAPARRETLIACWAASGTLDPAFGDNGLRRLRFFDDVPNTRPLELHAEVGDGLLVDVSVGTAEHSERGWIRLDIYGRAYSPELGISRGLGPAPERIREPVSLGMGALR